VYWGVGGESAGLFPNRDGILQNAGSHLFAFELPRGHDHDHDSDDE
jgi:hypothetical protein